MSAAPVVVPAGPGEPVHALAVRVAAARSRRHRRTATVVAVGSLFALAAATASLLLGAAGLGVGDVLAALVGQGSPKAEFVIMRLRLPRVLAAIIAGTALGLGGALFQTTLRNPLASPDILGVTGGASLAAVGSMLLLGLEGPVVSLAAFAGALVVAALMWGLAWRDGLTGIRFVLVGIGLASIVSGLLGWLITRAEVREASEALVWMVGGIASIGWPELGHRRRGARRAPRAHRRLLAADAAARALRRQRALARTRCHPRPRRRRSCSASGSSPWRPRSRVRSRSSRSSRRRSRAPWWGTGRPRSRHPPSWAPPSCSSPTWWRSTPSRASPCPSAS